MERAGWAADGCEENSSVFHSHLSTEIHPKQFFFPSSEVAIMINMFTLEKL